MSKGQVIRPDDRRRGPHSPEHVAAIKLGMARSRWSDRQSSLARVGLPHALVPVTERAAKAFSHHPMHDRVPVVGECHWCYFWGTSAPHVDDDPEPVEDDAVTLARQANLRVRLSPPRTP